MSLLNGECLRKNTISGDCLRLQANFRMSDVPVLRLEFMDNAEWDVASARDKGMIASFLQPLDKPVTYRVMSNRHWREWRGYIQIFDRGLTN